MLSESKRAVALRHLSHRLHRIFRWKKGACRGGWSSPRPETRRGSYERVKGEKKGKERVVGKAAGDERVFIPGRGSGLADEASSDAMPDVAGGESGHGAAKPDAVIHRCLFNRL
jgi:hypothetical protein